MTSESADVVVIGAGVNGLAAAALLAKAGRRVVVVERNAVPGGAVRTEEVTLPGFRHDLFAMNLSLFAGGPVMAALGPDLARHGFTPVGSQRPFCSLFPDDTLLGVEADAEATAANIAALAPEDLTAWRELGARVLEWMPHLTGVLGAELPSVAAARVLWRAQRALGWTGLAELARVALSSTRALTGEHFTNPRTRALLASWGMHLDFAPDIPGGALFSLLETFGGQQFGMVIGAGGAATLITALAAVVGENGGEVRCGSPVEEILVGRDGAGGVRLADGTRITAHQAVVANVNPALVAGLLPGHEAARPAVARVRGFQPGLATMMIHLALRDLPPWRAGQAGGFNYVHIGGYLDDMALAYTQAAAGQLPQRPTLVVGQPTVTDPSRAPSGRHVLWVQVRVVPSVLADGSSWACAGEPYADHVLSLLEAHAPGLSELVLGRCVLTPADLERHDVNLIGGDSLGGSHHPAQFFFLRPTPGWARHRAPVPRLYVCGAGTWPGAGVGGVSGWLVARALTRSRPGSGARAGAG